MDIAPTPRRRADNAYIKLRLHPNQAFRKAAEILLTTECLIQIEDLAEHLAGQTAELS